MLITDVTTVRSEEVVLVKSYARLVKMARYGLGPSGPLHAASGRNSGWIAFDFSRPMAASAISPTCPATRPRKSPRKGSAVRADDALAVETRLLPNLGICCHG